MKNAVTVPCQQFWVQRIRGVNAQGDALSKKGLAQLALSSR